MKIILLESQLVVLNETLDQKDLKKLCHNIWDKQKKRGETPYIDDIIYEISQIEKRTFDDITRIRPIWYEYNGGFGKLYDKLKSEILDKVFYLVNSDFNLNTKIKVKEIDFLNGILDIYGIVDTEGTINVYTLDEETDEEIVYVGTILDAYHEALSAYDTGDLTGAINAEAYDFFTEKLEKYGIPIDTEVDLDIY